MAPLGSHLTTSQLAEALLWRLTAEIDSESPELTTNEICSVEEQLTTASVILRSLRNRFCPVNRLPPETLRIIFDMVQPHYSDFRPALEGVRLNKWLPVSLVCQYWRKTAFMFASLWTTIDLYRGCGDAAHAFLARSSTIPIKVYHAGPSPDSETAVSEDKVLEVLATEHSYRFQEFHIISCNNIRTSVWNFFHFPAPILESLSLSVEEGDEANPILPPLFSGHTPRLKKLAIRFFSSWPGNTFKDLTHISLHYQSESGRYTFFEFLDILEASPRLEELVLIEAGPRPDDIVINPEEVRRAVELKHLHTLQLGFWPSVRLLSTFLSHLVVSPALDLRIWSKVLFSPDNDLSSLFPPHSPGWEVLSDITKVRLTHSSQELQLISVRDSTLHVHGEFWPSQYLSLSGACSPEKVEELWVGYLHSDPTKEQWTELLLTMPCLKSFTIFRTNPHPILSVFGLYDPSEEGQDVSHRGMICPALEALHIHNNAMVSSFYVSLFAEKRSKNGHPLRQLRITREGQPDDEERLLKRHIENIEFVDELGMEAITDVVETIWPNPASSWP